MRLNLRALTPCVGSTLGAALLVALLTVRLYWGFWFGPPSSEFATDSLTSVDRFSTLAWDGKPASGSAALRDAALRHDVGLGDCPWGRLPAALERRGLLPAGDQDVSPAAVEAVKRVLAAEGRRVEKVRMHVAEGRTADGESALVAAVCGSELSDDHYPYDELAGAFEAGELRATYHTHYRYDVAGLEGFAHFLVGGAAGMLVACGWALVFLCGVWVPSTRAAGGPSAEVEAG